MSFQGKGQVVYKLLILNPTTGTSVCIWLPMLQVMYYCVGVYRLCCPHSVTLISHWWPSHILLNPSHALATQPSYTLTHSVFRTYYIYICMYMYIWHIWSSWFYVMACFLLCEVPFPESMLIYFFTLKDANNCWLSETQVTIQGFHDKIIHGKVTWKIKMCIFFIVPLPWWLCLEILYKVISLVKLLLVWTKS